MMNIKFLKKTSKMKKNTLALRLEAIDKQLNECN
jgi:hypothetical protein